MLNMTLIKTFALAIGLFSGSISADECDRADKLRSLEACASLTTCQWCIPSGLVPTRPMCISLSGSSFVPKQIYTCSKPLLPTKLPTQLNLQSSIVDDDCDDDDNDICDLHKRDQSGCMANPMCTWCVSSGLFPATPDCVLISDAPWIPKQIYTCASKIKVQTQYQTSNLVVDDDCDDDRDDDFLNQYTDCITKAFNQGLDISLCDQLKTHLKL